MESVVEDYLRLGLRLGRHVEGFVDAYYGPPYLAREAAGEAIVAPARLAEDAGRLLAELDGGAGGLDDGRRR